MVLQPGDAAPNIAAQNQDGATVEPQYDTPTVVYFYPEDGTPGCTTEAEQFQLEAAAYDDAGVDVYGVSVDSVESHAEFAREHGIEFDLLADSDGAVAEAFGVELRDDGRTPRTTVVIVDGEVHRVYERVSAEGHARDVLMDLLDDGVVSLE
ncbi:MAG: peroxiredoxin [Salinirussus sp.]